MNVVVRNSNHFTLGGLFKRDLYIAICPAGCTKPPVVKTVAGCIRISEPEREESASLPELKGQSSYATVATFTNDMRTRAKDDIRNKDT